MEPCGEGGWGFAVFSAAIRFDRADTTRCRKPPKNDISEPGMMPLIPKTTSRRTLWVALFLLLLIPIFTMSGCGYTAPPPVPDTIEKAWEEGETKKAAAEAAAKAGDTRHSQELWNTTAAYYGAVAAKYDRTDNGLKATLEQVKAQEAGHPDNPAVAQMTMKSAMKKYTEINAPTVYPEAKQEYDALIQRIDAKNSQTIQYKVMDGLVHAFGNNPKISPILAVLAVAVIVTVVVWPLRVKQYKSMKEMQRYMPELQKIMDKYKNDPQTAMTKRQAFLKEHGVNEYAGCLPMLLQLPVTYFMYMVILNYQFKFSNTYFFWINPTLADMSAKWPWPFTHAIGHNLGEPDLLLLVIYAISMFLQTKLMPTSTPTDPAQAEQQRMMTVTMPIVFFVMMLQWQIASAFVLYWFTSNVLGLAQQAIIYKSLPQLPPLVIKSDIDSDTKNGGGPAADAAGDSGEAKKTLAANRRIVSSKTRRRVQKK